MWNRNIFIRVSVFFGIAHLLFLGALISPYFIELPLEGYGLMYFLALFVFPFGALRPYVKTYKNILFSLIVTIGQLLAMGMYIKFMGKHFSIIILPPLLYYAIIYLFALMFNKNN